MTEERRGDRQKKGHENNQGNILSFICVMLNCNQWMVNGEFYQNQINFQFKFFFNQPMIIFIGEKKVKGQTNTIYSLLC